MVCMHDARLPASLCNTLAHMYISRLSQWQPQAPARSAKAACMVGHDPTGWHIQK